MSIPLPSMLRSLRVREFQAGLSKMRGRWALAAWAFVVQRPWLYHRVAGVMIKILSRLGRRRGQFRTLPLVGGWTRSRNFPSPQGATFQTQWRAARGAG